MDRQGGKKEKMRKCREWNSLLILPLFSLHFLIFSPFSCSQAARLPKFVQPCIDTHKKGSTTPFWTLWKHFQNWSKCNSIVPQIWHLIIFCSSYSEISIPTWLLLISSQLPIIVVLCWNCPWVFASHQSSAIWFPQPQPQPIQTKENCCPGGKQLFFSTIFLQTS